MGNSHYKLTNADVKAKFICLDVGITCEPIPTKNGKFRVGVHKHGELIKIRDAEFEYDEQDYALHESYRALSQIINNGSQ